MLIYALGPKELTKFCIQNIIESLGPMELTKQKSLNRQNCKYYHPTYLNQFANYKWKSQLICWIVLTLGPAGAHQVGADSLRNLNPGCSGKIKACLGLQMQTYLMYQTWLGGFAWPGLVSIKGVTVTKGFHLSKNTWAHMELTKHMSLQKVHILLTIAWAQ